MKKQIIISGPSGSGKSHIAKAFEFMDQNFSWYTTSDEILRVLSQDQISPAFNATLIIIDECTIDKIVEIRECLEREPPFVINNSQTFIFITNEDPFNMGLESLDQSLFHIIYTDRFELPGSKPSAGVKKMHLISVNDLCSDTLDKANKIKIDIKVNGQDCSFNSETNLISTTTRHKVAISAEAPPNWATTRIVQFMESLLTADLT